MDRIIEILNNRNDNNFTYLKIYDVEYLTNEKICTFTLLYPESTKEISSGDREKITNFFIDYLKLNSKIIVKFKKSYLEHNLILKEIMQFLKNNYSSVFAYISENQIKIENKNVYIEICFDLAKNVIENINIDKFKNACLEYLDGKFCGTFSIIIKETKDFEYDDLIENRLNQITNSHKPQKIPRYKVIEPIMLVGKEFYFEPEYIKNIKQEKNSVILAGRIKDIVKKSFVKKRKNIEQEKAYYNFVLDEGKSKINCVYFCPKSNEPKMDKLANGDSVVMIGNVQRSYNGLSYNVKTIALCEIPDNIYELLEQQKVEVEEKFMFVTPEKIENVTQEDLFSQGPMYKKHILENEFVVFDVETTGLDADTCEIIEIGACKIRKGIITEKFQTLIKPKRPISELITNLTGIDNSMVASCHTIEDIIKDFHYFCKNAILVGYNVNFDIKFIQNSAKLVGMSFDNAVEDAMTLAREKLRLSNYKLGTVVKALDIKLLNAHRAYNDALATAKAFLKLSEI